MPSINVQTPAGFVYRLDTTDPAKIGPWLGEQLVSAECDTTYGPVCVTVYPRLLPNGQPDWPPEIHTVPMDTDGRKQLIRDFANYLGFDARVIVESDMVKAH